MVTTTHLSELLNWISNDGAHMLKDWWISNDGAHMLKDWWISNDGAHMLKE